MAIIIKADMPTCCGLCCECIGGGSDAYYCNRAKRPIGEVVPPYDKRMEWCPIIAELPDKHGRLIDADLEIKTLDKSYCKECDNWNGVRCKTCDHYWAMQVLEDAPTVLEASE